MVPAYILELRRVAAPVNIPRFLVVPAPEFRDDDFVHVSERHLPILSEHVVDEADGDCVHLASGRRCRWRGAVCHGRDARAVHDSVFDFSDSS